MKHCFIVQVHKNFDQVVLLTKLLDYADVYIHVDSKSNQLNSLLKEYIKSNGIKHVFLLEERVLVNWSGFSQVKATIYLMEQVLESKREYDYVHLISAQDLPLKTMDQIDNIIFEQTKISGNSQSIKPQFINCDDISSYRWRVKCYSFFRENRNNRKFIYKVIDNVIRMSQVKILHYERKNLTNYDMFIGSSWFTLTLDCIQFMCNYIKENEDFLQGFKYTMCADEHFFQILLMNSEYKSQIVNNNLRYVNFPKGKSSPSILDLETVKCIIEKPYIFARKFDDKIDLDAILYISNKLLSK